MREPICASGVVAIFLFAFAISPCQSPDEPAHFARADQFSRGALFAYRLDTAASGGVVSAGIEATVQPFEGRAFQSARADDAGDVRAGRAGHLGQFRVRAVGVFQHGALSAAAASPVAAAILAGKFADMRMVSTLRLARVANGLVSVALGAAAIAFAGVAAPWIFALLSLPTSLARDGVRLA